MKKILVTTARKNFLSGEHPKSLTRAQYFDKIIQHGGFPIAIVYGKSLDRTYMEEMIAMCDGLLLTGGGDINPSRYHAKLSSATGHFTSDVPMEIDDLRDEVEIELLNRFLVDKKPVLGICRGMQLLNVVLGGTLQQDLSASTGDAKSHFHPGGEKALDKYLHEVTFAHNRIFADLEGQKFSVNSFHHQALELVSPKLNVVASAPDGIIEAVELSDSTQFVFGVQWHPEQLSDELSERIFGEFLECC